jgi:hypothetical protein
MRSLSGLRCCPWKTKRSTRVLLLAKHGQAVADAIQTMGANLGRPWIRELAKQTATHLRQDVKGVTGGQHGIANTARLILDCARRSLQAALVSRDCRGLEEGEVTDDKVEKHMQESLNNADKAKTSWDELEVVVKRIWAANAAHQAAETSEKAVATALLASQAAEVAETASLSAVLTQPSPPQDLALPTLVTLQAMARVAKDTANALSKLAAASAVGSSGSQAAKDTADAAPKLGIAMTNAALECTGALLASTQVVSLMAVANPHLALRQASAIGRAVAAACEAAQKCAHDNSRLAMIAT